MAIKVKRKKTTREEAKQPDQIYTFNERVFNYLEQNRKIVLGGLAVILVTIVIVTFIARRVSESGRQTGTVVTEATLILSAPVGEAPAGAQVAAFATEAERSRAIQAVLADISDPPPAARLLDALSSLSLGDTIEAHDAYEAASRVQDAPLLSLLALQGLAVTQAQIGEVELAESTLAQFAETSPGLEDFAKMEMGRLNEAAGRLEQAYEHYEALASGERLAVGSGVLVGGIRAITEAARHRAQVLAVVLGISEAEQSPMLEEPIE